MGYREYILDFERIHDLRVMQLTLELLRRRIGSPVSLASLAGDVHCAPNTIRKYLEIWKRSSLFSAYPPIITTLPARFSRSIDAYEAMEDELEDLRLTVLTLHLCKIRGMSAPLPP
jgi:predicted AAA+ superfamily ATPase